MRYTDSNDRVNSRDSQEYFPAVNFYTKRVIAECSSCSPNKPIVVRMQTSMGLYLKRLVIYLPHRYWFAPKPVVVYSLTTTGHITNTYCGILKKLTVGLVS